LAGTTWKCSYLIGCKVGCKVVVKFFGMMACIAHCDVAERLVSMDTLGWNYMEVQTADAK